MAKAKKVKAEVEHFNGNLEELIVQALIEKKGMDIVCINLKKINHVFFDYFIICTGNSKTHVETLSDFVQETTKRFANTKASFIEGTDSGEWILLDYFNIIVHIFQPEARAFYNIESLWNDAEIQKF
ncbi:MAG: ribosome silencing factor [Bacteroidales bacterium]